MAATGPDSTNTSELPSFSVLKDSERRAVILKGEGKSNPQIAAHINDEFAQSYSERTVQEWFVAGGRLEQAYSEFQEAKAHLALQEARQIIKIATKAAAANMISKINSPDDRVSLDASRHLLNKYIPDRQIISDSPEPESDLPEELQAAATALREADDADKPVDEPSVGGTDPATPGA
jgi:hypothetical protein